MAPKAKAKVKAKAKAGGGVRHRRPAALAGGRRGGAPVVPGAGGRVRRRGGAHSWNAGRECALHEVRLEDFKVGQILEISDGIYYGGKDKGVWKTGEVGDVRGRSLSPVFASPGDHIRGPSESFLIRSNGTVCDPSMLSRVQTRREREIVTSTGGEDG